MHGVSAMHFHHSLAQDCYCSANNYTTVPHPMPISGPINSAHKVRRALSLIDGGSADGETSKT